MTPDIQELEDKALKERRVIVPSATILALIEVVKRQGEALDEIAYGEIHTRENGKTFRCQMSGRAMQAKARSALTAHKEKSDV